MKYKLTPLNIVSGILLIIAIYLFIKPGTLGFGFIVGLYFLPIILLTLTFDFLIQKLLKEKLNLYLIEISIIGLLYFFYLDSERTKTYIIPDNFENKYIITVYNSPNKSELPKGWNYQIKIPENGMMYTSSKKKSDLRKTKFITKSGIDLSSGKNDLGFGEILDDTINCKGKTYEFTVWKVQKFCCGYSSDETEKIKKSIQKEVCR